MTLIGRNSPCPCGSGKKYKKCCLNDSESTLKSTLESTHQAKLKQVFQTYEKKSLLVALGGLLLLPSNHSHTLRLEVALRIASSLKQFGTVAVRTEVLVKQLNQILKPDGAIGIHEDPPENLFTENIIFDGGNYTIYPGISEALYFLRRLLWVVRKSKVDYPREFRNKAYKSIVLMLFLSNEIAKKAGHVRNMESPDTWREDIVCNIEDAEKYCNAITFNKDLLVTSLQSINCLSVLGEFCTTPGDDSLNIEGIHDNPLLARPLIDLGTEIVVALPGYLMNALRHYILNLAKRFNILKKVMTECINKAWVDNDECMRLLGYHPLELQLPENNTGVEFRESLFVADRDKVVCVILVPDDGDGYDSMFSHWEASTYVGEQVTKRITEIWQGLAGCFGFTYMHALVVPMCIGRTCALGLGDLPKELRVTIIHCDELEIFSHLRDCDSLTLWKFTEALDEVYISPISSFLDKFSFYRKQNNSFYADDDHTYSAIYMGIGIGLDLRAKAARLRDSHGVPKGNPPSLVEVIRKYDEEHIPIYFSSRDKEFLVEGFKFPLWIKPINEASTRDEAHLFFDFSDTIAYWVWQINIHLGDIIPGIDFRPLHIEYELQNLNNWLDKPTLDEFKERTPMVNYKYDAQAERILLYVSDSLIPTLISPDNEGERVIVSVLLDAFAEIAYQRSVEISVDRRCEIKEICAPLGMKKKFLCIPAKGTALWSADLPLLRILQEHDVERQLNNLVIEIGEGKRKVGAIKPCKDKTVICSKIVDLFHKRIANFISELDSLSLLVQLMGQYEALINIRAFTALTIPATINCFSEQENYVHDLQKRTNDRDATSVSVRALIEFVAAQPTKGGKCASTTDLDQLIAMMYHLINWANLSDNIHLEIIDPEMSILGSGRIGVKKDVIYELVLPFYTEKTVENIETAHERFISRFDNSETEKRIDSDIENRYNMAFVAEFDCTIEEVVDVFLLTTCIGFESETSICSMPLKDFIEKVNEELGWSMEKTESFLKHFSLKPREKWEKPPEGFLNEDIWPWRYNRRLSYIRRPFILTFNKEDATIYWGTRCVEDAGRQLFSLIQNGRYKCDRLTAPEMKELVSSINDELGKRFVTEVIEWINLNSKLKTHKEITIRPNGDLIAETDLGDIDILAFDDDANIVYSMECKNINSGRNPREIANEIERFIESSEEEKSWTQKHIDRDSWLRANILDVIQKFHSNVSNPNIVSVMIVSEEIPTKYLRSINLPLVSLSQLKREGLDAIKKN